MKSLALLALLSAVGAPAAQIIYTANLDGPSESPANASPGTGFVTVTVDTAVHTMRIEASFSDLLGTTTGAHIHCCTALPNTSTAGVANEAPSLSFFPLGVTSGTFDNTLDTSLASSYNPAFITANGGTAVNAEAALFAGLDSQRAYFDIHSSVFPGGEIRGFLVAESVPEPGTWFLAGAGLLALWKRRR